MSLLGRVLPEQVKAAIRPTYRRLVAGLPQEASSNLTIDRFGEFDFAYRRETTDEIIIGNLRSYHLPDLIPGYTPRGDDVIVNIGAHIGVFALMASRSAPDGKVFAIEASKETFNYLRINSALNRADNILPRHLAVSDTDGPCTLYYDTSHWGHSITKQLSSQTEIVDGVTLSRFFRDNSIDRCNLLFLNCEGAEFPILLSSSRETLSKIDTIQSDCHRHLWSKNTPEDLAAHLASCGFHAELLRNEEGYDRVLAKRK